MRGVAARLYRHLRRVGAAGRYAAGLTAFRARRVLARHGICRKAILLMSCAEERETEGFYGQFTGILGMLDCLETWPDSVAGVRVDFGDRGLYFDPAHGGNSWQYHFEPIDVGCGSDAVDWKLGTDLEEQFYQHGEQLPRARAFQLIDRYIRPRPHIREKVDAFVRMHFAGFHVLGIHYRGTDKWVEARRVPYAEICAAVRDALGAQDGGRYRLFVASDEQGFVDHMEREFPGKVSSWCTLRAPEANPEDSDPIDFAMGDNFRKGEDAVIDCLLLSRCDALIRTLSSLGLCAGFFNPAIPVRLLNQYHVPVSNTAW